MAKRKKRRKGKKLPPESLFDTPESYYRGDVLKAYTHSKTLMRIQERITKRAVEILDIEPPALILDLGCGAGFSTSYLYLTGYTVVGVDLIYDMLVEYDITELNPVNGDFRALPLRDKPLFDYVISISAFQWIINRLEGEARKKVVEKIARKISAVLKPGGKAIIQFYPLDSGELRSVGRYFAEAGKFDGHFIIDNPLGGPKKKIFLYLEKKKTAVN